MSNASNRTNGKETYDLVILGGGPGGYRAAERAGARGLSVAMIEHEQIGGVCLNHGCIPTKTLLHGAKLYVHAREGKQFGVTAPNAAYDLAAAMKYKKQVMDRMRRGVAYLMKKYGVTVVEGHGKLCGPGCVRVDGTEYRGRNVIVATGSSPVVIPVPGSDGPNVVTNRQILTIDSLPKRLVIIGGGVIGMEFASYFSSVGTEVHVVEMLDEIVPVLDPDISAALRKAMKKVTYHLGARVTKITETGVEFEKKGERETLDGDLVLMSVGRRPNVADNGFEEAGLDVTNNAVAVDERMRTNLPATYAVGDVTGKSLLAHSAYRMADVAVKNMTGEPSIMRYGAVPWVVYTMPEAAGCGMTEQEARDAGHRVRTGSTQMLANGRFLAEYGREAGLVKVVADEETDRLLGVHMLGGGCSEMIFGAATMLEAELRVSDIEEIIFPHPTVSESIQDTLWALGE